MPNTGKTELPNVNTIHYTCSRKDDRPEEYRESLLGLLEHTERSEERPGGQSTPGPRAQYNSFSKQSINVPAINQIKNGQAVIERPISSMSQSAVFDDTVRSPK